MNAYFRDPGLVLADRWQRGFPLSRRPFAEVGSGQGLSEGETIETFGRLRERGLLGRIGAVVRPNCAGASTLAAVSVTAKRLENVAQIISAEPFVNHNYLRDHAINLWFVVTAPGEPELAGTLRRIEARAGCEVLDLRLIEPYHIDLGFVLGQGSKRRCCGQRAVRAASGPEKQLLAAIEDGLPLEWLPYKTVAGRLHWEEWEVTRSIGEMLVAGIISRFGCVLRHREIGYVANAMTVWDVDDSAVDAIGRKLAEFSGVTLCYRRRRAMPRWPYNLYAMVHGHEEAAVRRKIAAMSEGCGLTGSRQEILFSRRCFMQRGARFGAGNRAAAA